MLPLDEIRHKFEAIAVEAGYYIMTQINKQFKTDRKSDLSTEASSIVTEVDINVQNLILSEVQQLQEEYDLGLLTEELEDDASRFKKEAFVCIDPLDGTLAFTKKEAGFSVSLALVSVKGDALVGVVYDPVNKNLYSSALHKGATKNGKAIKFKHQNKKLLVLFADLSLCTQPEYPTIISNLKQKAAKLGLQFQMKQGAGAVLNAIWTAEHFCATYIKPPKVKKGGGGVWDFAASACIVKEMGVEMLAYNKRELNLNPRRTTYMNEQGVFLENF